MNPALSQASNAHLPVAHMQPTVDVSPGPSEDLYAEVKPKGRQVAITDKRLMTFTSGTVEVVPERLLPVDARFGLSDIPDLKLAGAPHACAANATMLPKGGVAGSAILFGAPGANTTRDPASAERLGRLAAVLTDNQVAHVVYVKHNSTSSALELPVGQSVEVKAQGGPLNVSLIPATVSSTGAPEAFYVQTTLPSGQSEQSGDIGLWSVNLSEASPAQLHQTLKELHEAAGGQTVAFGCQSGTTRSGGVAQLYYQRQQAEKLFREGRHPSAEELTQAATDWGTTCKQVRANEFANRMPADMLKEHATLLADEFRQRPLEAPRMPAPLVQPKPAASTAKLLNLATKPPATPPKPHGMKPETQGAKARPDVAPKTGPQTAPKPQLGAAARGEEPPPKPPRSKASDSKGSDSSDTDSVFSGVSSLSVNSDSTFGSGLSAARPTPTPAPRKGTPPVPAKPMGEQIYAPMNEKTKVAARPSHPYGVGVELKPLPPKSSPPPSDFYAVASAIAEAAPESEYSDIDDTYARIRGEGPSARAEGTSEAQPFRLQARQSIRRMRDHVAAGFNRTVDIPIEPNGADVTSTRLHAWQSGQHEQHEALIQYLDGAGKTFAQRADQGFRFFAAKDTYGIGLTLANLKTQAHSPVWSRLAQALEQTLDEAPQGMTNITHSILTVVMQDRLKSQYLQMDDKQKDIWTRRTGKKEFATTIQTLEQELHSLSEQAEQDHQDQALLASQLRSANLRLLTLKSLYLVGTDPTLPHPN